MGHFLGRHVQPEQRTELQVGCRKRRIALAEVTEKVVVNKVEVPAEHLPIGLIVDRGAVEQGAQVSVHLRFTVVAAQNFLSQAGQLLAVNGGIHRQRGQLAALVLELFFEQGALLLFYNALLFGQAQVLFGLDGLQSAGLYAHHSVRPPAHEQVNSRSQQHEIENESRPGEQQRARTAEAECARIERLSGGVLHLHRQAVRTVMQVAERAYGPLSLRPARWAATFELPYETQGGVIVVGKRRRETQVAVHIRAAGVQGYGAFFAAGRHCSGSGQA